MFKPKEKIIIHHWATRHRPFNLTIRQLQIDRPNVTDRKILLWRRDRYYLSKIAGAIPQNKREVNPQITAIIFQNALKIPSAQAIGITGSVRLSFQLLKDRRPHKVQVLRPHDSPIGKQQTEGRGHDDAFVMHPISDSNYAQMTLLDDPGSLDHSIA